MRMGYKASIAVFSLSCWCFAGQPELIPSFLLQKLKQMRTDYVVVQLWSPFCSSCGEEVGELNQALKLANQERQVLSIFGIPVQTRRTEAKLFVEHFKPTYEQWEPNEKIKYQTLPRTLLFNQDRALVKEWIGKLTHTELLAELKGRKVK